MRRLDELHMDFPFAGSRMLGDLLAAEGVKIGRLQVSTLIKKMAIEAIYRRASTSKPALGHKVYPYLLRKLAVTRPNQVWAMRSLLPAPSRASISHALSGSPISPPTLSLRSSMVASLQHSPGKSC